MRKKSFDSGGVLFVLKGRSNLVKEELPNCGGVKAESRTKQKAER